MALPQREAAFVPGGLSGKHAQILDNRVVSERCSLCHPNSHTYSTATGAIATQDELCGRCHEGHLPQLHLRSPHDMDRDKLKQLTLNALSSRGLLVSKNSKLLHTLSSSPSDRNLPAVAPQFASLLSSSEIQTTCTNCHIEHHGRSSDLQAITDTRCQACHAKQFKSFVDGHPEFNNYPVQQSRRIAFTHQAHLEKHFAKKNETFDCTKCHLDSNQRGGVGSVFRTLSFETACARCHDEAISAAAVDGWVLLQLPSVKPGDTQQSALGLTDWPLTAQFGYEGSIPLVMRALLMADSSTEIALQRLPESGDLKAIPDFAKTGRDATISIAVGTRTLISDIASGGQAAWRKRLESVLAQSLARDLSPRETKLIDELCAGLPPDIFRQMEQNWFGEVAGGVALNEVAVPSRNAIATQLVSAQDDLLSGSTIANEDDDKLFGGSAPDPSPTQLTAPESDEDLLLGKASESTSPRGRQKLTKLRGAIHVVQGGWYLDNETLSLRYMPRGHNDPTLAAWSEYATLLAGESVDNTDDPVKHAELSKQVPGGCTQCHVLGVADTTSALIQSPWKAVSKPATARSITTFDHTPHLTLPILADCKYCHQLGSNTGARSHHVLTTANGNSSHDKLQLPACEFKSMHLEQCSACHRPNAASTGCTQCHNYHVTETSPSAF
jgi:hypothetical protein